MTGRVVVVGAGISGCVLASRIADRFEVVVVEAGPWPEAESTISATRPQMNPPWWSLSADLTATRRWTATPGRAVGGSSVINGGCFVAPELADLELWHRAGGDAWETDRVAELITELGVAAGAHTASQAHPIVDAFVEVSAGAGNNAGLLRLQTTVVDGVPWPAGNLLSRAEGDPPIEVRSNCRALRVVVEDGRAIGVEVADADGWRGVIEAEEVVIASGGFGTPRLLLASGIGPADQLLASGIPPVIDLPGVGAAFSDHPTVWVEWVPTAALAARDATTDAADGAFPIALRMGADGGAGDDLEILVCTVPPERAFPSDDDYLVPPFGLIVGLQRPYSRGTVVAASANPLAAPTITFGYLADARDRAALRTGVRRAAELLSAPSFGDLVERLVDLDDETLRDDDCLDEWIAQRLGSAAHTCGSAPMGAADDLKAVVDGAGRVRGIRNLRIADTSILPVVPSRGPASAAMAIGAILAEQMLSGL